MKTTTTSNILLQFPKGLQPGQRPVACPIVSERKVLIQGLPPPTLPLPKQKQKLTGRKKRGIRYVSH